MMEMTMWGEYPGRCCDCGEEKCVVRHYGPLVPDKKTHLFCFSCWSGRIRFYDVYHKAQPLGAHLDQPHEHIATLPAVS